MNYNNRMDDHRPDPDTLLRAIQKDESRQGRGKLKIFMGMAAGVGKTYAMLDNARRQAADGVDIVVGYVETHHRAETDAILGNLEVIPRRKVEYHGTILEEMDTDAILARNPDLVLVDELAHTNAPGSRHVKRYQDITDLLASGLNVWTTVNVQHFESRVDAVRQITGITIHEPVPDSLLDEADEIELIDLSPLDLRKRLAEGKVYTAENAEVAASNFFRVGNLTALREMALRLTAEHVDHKLQDYMQLKQIAGPWKSGERLMVAVGPSPFSERLIRWTRRMAYNLEAPWLAVYIETSDNLSVESKNLLARNIALARSLGGEIVTVRDEATADALLRIAHQRNVTQIVIGKPRHSRLQTFLRGGALVDRVIRSSGDIDVYVVNGDETVSNEKVWQRFPASSLHSQRNHYLLALLVVSLVNVLGIVANAAIPWLGYQAIGLIELFAVLLIASYVGRGPALMAAVISALTLNYLFISPLFTFSISRPEDIILFVLYFAIAIFTGNLTARIRRQENLARSNADRTMALYTLAHETATAMNMDDVLRTAVTQIGGVFDADVVIILPEDKQLLRQPHPASTLDLNDKEYSVVQWVYARGKSAGRFTETLSQALAQYHPLQTPTRTVGVIGIRTHTNKRLSFDQEVMLETFMSQIALVIEREMLDEAAEQSAMLRESERLYAALLNSISHELRTPIATIKGASSSLLEAAGGVSETARVQLTNDIQSAADRLNRLVENLLDMSRLESGRLQIKQEWCDIGDLMGVAVRQVDECARHHHLKIEIEPNLPLIQIDFVLIEQVVVNLLDNACNYTPEGSTVMLAAQVHGKSVEISVSDNGPGISPELIERIFEKFYRVPGTATGGTGLGLSISRGLVEAHGGRLTAAKLPTGGTKFIVRLPLNGSPPPVQEAHNG